MSDFKGRHFRGEIVLWAVRWYCRTHPISYRDLEAMMTERGVAVDHSTIYRWVQRFAPEMEKRLRWQWRRPQSRSWRVDETYIKVRGKWAYLYRAVDKLGNMIDFYLSATRNTKAAKRFLGKALRGLKEWEQPVSVPSCVGGCTITHMRWPNGDSEWMAAVPTSSPSLKRFAFRLRRMWLRVLRRRSQMDRTKLDKLGRVAAAFWPPLQILHPWPEQRFAVKHPR